MKLKHNQKTNYSLEFNNHNGLFSKAKADIHFPLHFIDIIKRLNKEKKEKNKTIILDDCDIELRLSNDSIDIFSVKGNKVKIDIKEDECFIGFSTDGVPLNLCIKCSEISSNCDIPISRALVNSTTFIFE